MTTPTSSTPSCSFIALVGAPNAGKSTLLNKMLGSKLSIVSPKVQTTRTPIKGICMQGDAQLVFIDTPGIFDAGEGKRLEKAIVKAAWTGMSDADMILVLVDAKRGFCHNTRLIVDGLKTSSRKAVLVLNKIDLVERSSLLGLAQELNDTGIFEETFMVSAHYGDGVEDIKEYLAAHAPEGPWMYDPDQLSTLPMRFLAAEITRETLFYRLQHELPYSLSVETEQWEDTPKGLRIHQAIYVIRESQKKIILGKNGQQIKEIGERARMEIRKLTGRKVHLFLFVKVRADWLDNPLMYKEMGLEFEG